LSRQTGKRRREPKQPIGKRQQVHAPSSQSGSSRHSQKQRDPFLSRLPSSAAPARLSICRMGHRSPHLPGGLEDPARRRRLHGERCRRGAPGPYASRQISSTTTQEVRLRPAYHRYQPDNCIVEVIFDGVAGHSRTEHRPSMAIELGGQSSRRAMKGEGPLYELGLEAKPR